MGCSSLGTLLSSSANAPRIRLRSKLPIPLQGSVSPPVPASTSTGGLWHSPAGGERGRDQAAPRYPRAEPWWVPPPHGLSQLPDSGEWPDSAPAQDEPSPQPALPCPWTPTTAQPTPIPAPSPSWYLLLQIRIGQGWAYWHRWARACVCLPVAHPLNPHQRC